MTRNRSHGGRWLVALAMVTAGPLLAGRAAASGPGASASPATGLHDSQVITVRGSGFGPDVRIQVLECQGDASHPPKDNHSCQGLTLDAQGVTSAAGAYLNSPTDPTHRTHGYRIHVLPLRTEPQGVRCGPRDPCGLYVGPQEGDFLKPHAFVPIAFVGASGAHSSAWPWVGLGVVLLLAVGIAGLVVRRRRSAQQAASG